MRYVKYLAAKAALHALARLSAGRAFSRLESRMFRWAVLAHDRWVYRAYGAAWRAAGCPAPAKGQPIVVE